MLGPAPTALLLPGSGSADSVSDDWIAALNLRLALISIGANGLGNPAPQVLAELVGRAVLRTDQHGAVTVETGGEQMWVTASR